jgi:hypothetical protein
LAQQASSYNVSNENFSITKKPMSMHVQNQSLSILGVETGLTGSPIGMPSVHGAQTGLTDTPTGLTGPTIPYNPVLENSASSNLEHDNANVVDWRIPIIDYLQDPNRKLIGKFGSLLSNSHWWMGSHIA